jgi:hypothetical protein
MALDFAIMTVAGPPKRSVPIESNIHKEILAFCRTFGGYSLIPRMTEYYEDASYEPEELSQLLNEVNRLRIEITSRAKSLEDTFETIATLEKMADLCREAIREGLPIEALSD